MKLLNDNFLNIMLQLFKLFYKYLCFTGFDTYHLNIYHSDDDVVYQLRISGNNDLAELIFYHMTYHRNSFKQIHFYFNNWCSLIFVSLKPFSILTKIVFQYSCEL